MIEIDRLPRLRFHDLRKFFDYSRQLQKKLQAHPDKREQLFSLFSDLKGEITFSWAEVFKVTICPHVDYFMEIDAFTFEWTYQGRRHKETVSLRQKPSNLGIGSVAYFVCPYTGKPCRTLYTDGNVLTSRRSFTHTYSERNQSHKWRRYNTIMKQMNEQPPRNRKMTYRGKPTPFAVKFYRKMEKQGDVVAELQQLLSAKVGRPRKSGGNGSIKPNHSRRDSSHGTPELFLK